MSQSLRRRRNCSSEVYNDTEIQNETIDNESVPLLSSHRRPSTGTVEPRPSGDGETCVFCRKKERVFRKGQIKKASHLELPRSQFLARIFGLWVYSHHVFVAKVEDHPEFPDDEGKVRLTLIESMPTRPYIRERIEDFDFNNDYVNIHLYEQPTFDEEECVRRAYQRLHEYRRWEQDEATYQGDTRDRTWSLANNCENFVMRIKTGVCISLMVRHAADTLVPLANTIFSKFITLARTILRFVGGLLDDVSSAVGNAGNVLEGSAVFSSVLGPVLIGVGVLLSLIIAIYDLYYYHKLRKNGKVCKGCYRQRVFKVITLLLASIALIGLGAVASYFGGWIVALGALLGGTLLYCVLAKSFKKMYTFFQSCFPTRGVPKSNGENLETTNPGDAITFKYFGLPHAGVVTRLTPSGMYVAHYAWVTLFTREIIEEPFSLDKLVHVYDFTHYAPYPQEEVVTRARQRVGEKRFNTLTNRSSHFVTWCKASKREGCGDNDWIEVFTWDEVKVGDAIKLWMYGRLHAAILANISTDKTGIQIYHFGHLNGVLSRREVKSDSVTFDLKVNSLRTRSYKNYTLYQPDEVIKRTKNCERNRKVFRNSDEFILYCKVK